MPQIRAVELMNSFMMKGTTVEVRKEQKWVDFHELKAAPIRAAIHDGDTGEHEVFGVFGYW
jgi:hypothetical protein